MPEKRICYCIVNLDLIVIEYFNGKHLGNIFQKKPFIARFYDQQFLKKYREQIVQSSVSCDIILDPQGLKFLPVGNLESEFCLRKNLFPSSRNANFKKVSLIIMS